MTALHNRTVTAESLDETVVGKRVIFAEEDGSEFEGEITAINSDGSFRVETDEGEWDLEDGDFEFIEEDDGVKTEEPEEVEAGDESEEEPVGVVEITLEAIMAMNLQELKAFAKQEGIKLPLRAYQKAELMKEWILKAMGLEKPITKTKPKTTSKAKDETVKKGIEKKKEKKSVPKKETIQRSPKGIIFEMYQTYTELLSVSPKTIKELHDLVEGKAKKTILSGTLYHFIRAGLALGVIIQDGNKFSIKK